ncbi:hypothetical protein HMPREF1254_0380 [Prevotella sp. BV3P1]|nr:hypothetical protein HMPREF1254_0380 [Prevotella sp. BV3P1]
MIKISFWVIFLRWCMEMMKNGTSTRYISTYILCEENTLG